MQTTQAYIALGSNLDDPRQHVLTAIDELDVLPFTRVTAKSNLHQTKPLGPQDQPDFINAVVAIATQLAPLALLHECLNLEIRHGRARRERWGPRTLDLDLLLYGDLHLTLPELVIPHPHMYEREFVLKPLAEIAPELVFEAAL